MQKLKLNPPPMIENGGSPTFRIMSEAKSIASDDAKHDEMILIDSEFNRIDLSKVDIDKLEIDVMHLTLNLVRWDPKKEETNVHGISLRSNSSSCFFLSVWFDAHFKRIFGPNCVGQYVGTEIIPSMMTFFKNHGVEAHEALVVRLVNRFSSHFDSKGAFSR